MFRKLDFTEAVGEVYPQPPQLETFFRKLNEAGISEKILQAKTPEAVNNVLGEILGTFQEAEQVLADMGVWIQHCEAIDQYLEEEIKKELSQPNPNENTIDLLNAFAHNFRNRMLPWRDFRNVLKDIIDNKPK